ncbi:MAG: hypothetical protein ACLFQK_04630 [Fibrobacterota bacterium]
MKISVYSALLLFFVIVFSSIGAPPPGQTFTDSSAYIAAADSSGEQSGSRVIRRELDYGEQLKTAVSVMVFVILIQVTTRNWNPE